MRTRKTWSVLILSSGMSDSQLFSKELCLLNNSWNVKHFVLESLLFLIMVSQQNNLPMCGSETLKEIVRIKNFLR